MVFERRMKTINRAIKSDNKIVDKNSFHRTNAVVDEWAVG